MSERIYIDTNICLDYCEKRSDGIRPLQEFAFSVFRRTLECEFEIIISKLVISEIDESKLRNKATLDLLISELKAKNKLSYVSHTYLEKARAQGYENWKDALHAIIAKREKCRFVVTRNIIDFLEFSDILEAKLPEEL